MISEASVPSRVLLVEPQKIKPSQISALSHAWSFLHYTSSLDCVLQDINRLQDIARPLSQHSLRIKALPERTSPDPENKRKGQLSSQPDQWTGADAGHFNHNGHQAWLVRFCHASPALELTDVVPGIHLYVHDSLCTMSMMLTGEFSCRSGLAFHAYT